MRISDDRLIWILPVVAGLVMLLPQWPGLIDLPGHVARYHVELDLQQNELLQRYYSFHWRLLPNLGIDLLIYPMARLFGFEWAVRLCVALIPALSVAGMLALARVTYGRIPATAFVALPCAFAYPLVFGFVNYCFSAALALLFAAGWLYLTLARRLWARLCFGVIVSPVLFIAHLTGWGLFGVTAFGMVVAAERPSGLKKAVAGGIFACLPLAWPILLMFAGSSGAPGVTQGWPDLNNVARHSIGMLREQFAVLDVPSVLLLFATALAPVIARRRFAYEPLLLLPALLLWVMVLVLPAMVLGSAFANVRLIPCAMVLTILAVRPLAPSSALIIFACAFFVFRLAVTATALLSFDAVAQRQLRALDHIRPGSRVLGFRMHECARSWAPPRSQNLTLLATARRDVLTNGHWAEAGAQLMSLDDQAFRKLALFKGNAVVSAPCRRWALPVLSDVLADKALTGFDYVWLLDVPDRNQPRDRRLRLIWKDRGSAVYAVVRLQAS